MLGSFKMGRLGALAAAATMTGAILAPTAAVMAQETAGPNTGKVSLTVGADYVSSYIFRGYENQDSGLILQPYASVAFEVYTGEDLLNSVSVYGGVWSSVHSDRVGTLATSTSQWYETDIFFGVAATIADDFGIDISWVNYTYPGNAFADIEEIDVKFTYDDSGLTESAGLPFSFSPYVLVAFEIDDGNGTDDSYLELGIAPSFEIFQSEDYPVTLTLPVTLGLSIDDYYLNSTGDNEFFGYVSFGALFSVPVAFIPSDYGSWEAYAGAVAYIFNDDVALNDTSEDFEVIGKVGVKMSY